MVDLVRQLVGCKQRAGSGFLCSVPVDKEMLSLQTYERVYQRLASTHRAVPLGIYRTVPISTIPDLMADEEKEGADLREDGYTGDEESIKRFLSARMTSLGLGQVNSDSEFFTLPS